jgi:predicted flap endonuclease-1-like 5' DNA nuclease
MNWFILIPAIVGLVCAVLGYLLGRLLSSGKTDNVDWKSKYLSAENDLSHCKDKLSAATIEIKALTTLSSKAAIAPVATIAPKAKPKARPKTKAKVTKTTTKSAKATPKAKTAPKAKATPKTTAKTSMAFDATLAKAAFGKRIKQDDLKIIEGIGPKIEDLFNNFGVKTWKDLSECTLKKCQEVLDSGGSRYQMHKPATWPKQAKLAHQGKWEELVKWQAELDGGK